MLKSTGLVRGLDELGRLVIPSELRKTMDFNPRQPLEIFTDGDKIVIKKYEVGCKVCGRIGNLKGINGLTICRDCAEEIARRFTEDTY